MTAFFQYTILATGFTAFAIYLSQLVTQQGQLWQFITLALLIAFPTLMAMLYTDTVAITHKSTRLKPGSHLMRFTTSRILSTVVWAVWSVCFGCWTVLWLSAASQLEWALLLAFIWVLYLINRLIFLIVRTQLAAHYATAESLQISRLLTAGLITAAFLFVNHAVQIEQPNAPLSSRLEAISTTPLDPSRSYLIQMSVRLHAHLQALQGYIIEQIQNATPLYILAMIAGTFALFYNFSLLLSAFLIPRTEYRRAFSPIEVNETPGPVSFGTIVFTSTIATLTAFLIFPGAANLEMYLRFSPKAEQSLQVAEARSVQLAEMIDNLLYQPGTIEKVAKMRLIGMTAQSNLIPPLQRQSRLAFNQMRENVDLFLDGYYSLSAEYLRLIGALTGQAEEIISNNLNSTLMSGDELAKFEQIIEDSIALSPAISEEYQRRVSAILDENRLDEPEEDIVVLASSNTDLLSPLPEHPSVIGLDRRMQASGAAAIGGVMVAKIVSKTAAKGGIKLAAKGLTKLAATKAGAGAAGAAAGAAIGTVFPVVGTAVGGVIGFGIGAALGISMDALLLKLDEHFSREEFKTQILKSIDEQQQEFDAMLSA